MCYRPVSAEMDSNQLVFFSLLRSGLWEQPARLSGWGDIDFNAVYELADNQSVVGLVAAGLEHVQDRKVTKPQALPFLKRVFGLESRNAEMNRFIADLYSKLREKGIYSLLVKGQGVAQSYERPLWRSPGDVDMLLDEKNYQKAKAFLLPLASFVDHEYSDRIHLALTIDSWTVELHGSMRSSRLGRVNACIDSAQDDTFRNGHVRVWENGDTDVFLPAVDNDIIFVFTHILQHFFAGGIGLRQICDWCRLLWTYRDEIDLDLLGSRLKGVRLKSEWEVFASLSVNYLGMPENAIPFYRKSTHLERKADRLMACILRMSNFEQNRDTNYRRKYPYLIRKLFSFIRVTRNVFSRFRVFPIDSIVFFFRYVLSGSKSAIKGE